MKEVYIDYQFGNEDAYSLAFILVSFMRGPGVVVELGSWYGMSSIVLGSFLRLVEGTSLYCIDNWKGEGSFLQETIIDKPNPKEVFIHNIKSFGLDDYIKVIESDSSLAAQQFEDNSIDLIFIDADHRYSGIKKDLAAWYPKVKETGTFCGHDYDSFSYKEEYIEKDCVDDVHHGVVKAVHEFFPRVNWMPQKIWWANKRNELVKATFAPSMDAISQFKFSRGKV